MKKIRKLIKTNDDFQRLLDILINRVKNNMPISNNAMMDDLTISFMITKDRFTRDLFLNNNLGKVLDGTMQQLELIVIWVTNNEDVLCDIYKNEILTSPNVVEIEDLYDGYEHDRMKLFNYSV